MVVDDELFFARRLGYGLKSGETIAGGIRDWAIKQISDVPPLEFVGKDGRNIRSQLPPLAEPVPGYEEATALRGKFFTREHELDKLRATMDEAEWQRTYDTEVDKPRSVFPEWREALLRSLAAVNGPSPVFERFWSFWVNHFSVKTEAVSSLWYGPHTRLIRTHMVGNFADMLQDAILEPAMLYYLDNYISAGPNSPAGRKNGETINENLARELLELHTMSPAGGYTQDDIIQASFALSGWTYYSAAYNEEKLKNTPTGVWFDVYHHEPGAREILGKTYSKGNKGKDQAPELIADLAMLPATAEFISWKLIRHFVADVPPPDSVARVKDAWLQSKGDLLTIHTAVIDEVLAKARDNEKFTSPTNWLHQLHRTAGIPIPTATPWGSLYWIDLVCAELGEGYAKAAQPNGYSDLKADWISKALLERRVRYAFLAAIKAKPEGLAYLLDYAVRLSGPDSKLVAQMRAAPSPFAAGVILLSSPQFMRI